jgi:peptidyl-prolyl cis-trans isomerase D
VLLRARTDPHVKPSDIRAYYDQHAEEFDVPATARVRLLAIRADLMADDPAAAKAAARAKADAAMARLRGGEDWTPVYRSLTKDAPDPDPEDGLLELVERGRAAEWIEAAAFEKPRGTLVLHAPEGSSTVYVLRSEGMTPARRIPFEEVQERIELALQKKRLDVAYYEVCLSLLEEASVRPAEVAAKLREYLSGARRKLLETPAGSAGTR